MSLPSTPPRLGTVGTTAAGGSSRPGLSAATSVLNSLCRFMVRFPLLKAIFKLTTHFTETASQAIIKSFSLKVLHIYPCLDTQPAVTLTQTPERVPLMHTGDTASFFCHINVSSGWQYRWYKDDQPLPDTESTYSIHSLSTSHSASYKCQVRRGADFKEDSQAMKLEVDGQYLFTSSSHFYCIGEHELITVFAGAYSRAATG